MQEKHMEYLIEMNEYLRQQLAAEQEKNKELERKLFLALNPERKLKKSLRLKVLKRDQFKCVSCDSKETLEVHHVLPASEGGLDEVENLVTLCLPCHIEAHEDNEKIANFMRSKLR